MLDETARENGRGHDDGAAVEEVLGRSTIEVVAEGFGEYLQDATVLVTGAGGSVGAELCAQLAQLDVGRLVLVDQAEAPLTGLVSALRHDLGFGHAVPVLADIKNRMRTVDVFRQHRPAVVFHAAAYKDVPLLEAFPVEGVATNILGTKCVVDAARRVGVARFVLFSTDKAVHPESILGQTKAVAEWVVAAAGREEGDGRYASIRLGNVVDSAGSIVPIFRRQVARGGPVTVTHPHARRYLITARRSSRARNRRGRPGRVATASSGSTRGRRCRVLELAQRLASSASHDVGIDVVGLRAGRTAARAPVLERRRRRRDMLRARLEIAGASGRSAPGWKAGWRRWRGT